MMRSRLLGESGSAGRAVWIRVMLPPMLAMTSPRRRRTPEHRGPKLLGAIGARPKRVGDVETHPRLLGILQVDHAVVCDDSIPPGHVSILRAFEPLKLDHLAHEAFCFLDQFLGRLSLHRSLMDALLRPICPAALLRSSRPPFEGGRHGRALNERVMLRHRGQHENETTAVVRGPLFPGRDRTQTGIEGPRAPHPQTRIISDTHRHAPWSHTLRRIRRPLVRPASRQSIAPASGSNCGTSARSRRA